ncbi:MAG: hypothetical protein GX591_17795 [Planctomycetes bacterium]|nr:hypothetical protein [Planctomycetota bacterium]
MSLNRDDVAGMIEKLRGAVRKETCWMCECVQGMLAQLELDVEDDVADLTALLKIARDAMHNCLGCDPCPPGDLHADYLRGGACGCDKGPGCCGGD